MKISKEDLWYLVILIIISFFTVADLFLTPGRSANMDGLIHITTIAQFSRALKDGDFPLRWLDSFANYGLPIGLFSHQLPTYVGAFINMLVNNPVLSFNIVSLIAVVLSNIFFYRFLRIYFSPLYAFLGAFMFNIAPYRILNLFIRGAIPETFAAIFLPLVLLSMYYIFQKKPWAFFLLIVSLTGIILTHPMMFVTMSFIFIPYFFFLLLTSISYKGKILLSMAARTLLFLVFPILFALAISGYYIIPLTTEVKYFYYGTGNHLTPGQYMQWQNFLDPRWYYFIAERNDIINRGHFIQVGLVELIGIVAALGYIIYKWLKTKKLRLTLLEFSVLVSLVILFFTIQPADFIYKKINILSNIQFPWRMLSAFIFLPPLVFAYLFSKLNKSWLVILLIFFLSIIRFPEMYGKNFANYPESSYYFTVVNLHSVNMNTIWTAETQLYPVKKNKAEVIEGKGTIQKSSVKNSSRQYEVQADTNIRMADYTFYFPGWKVYIDGQVTPIEFQDPQYRGVITYKVPPGKHTILVRFEDTKVRKLGDIVSLSSTIAFLILVLLEFRFRILEKFLNKNKLFNDKVSHAT